ncbi:glycoside hydrolase family protein [Algoriphagus pacificus]|uniref:Agl cluster protein AglQ n=1 Tax=Algoriphagus pacificus TaxID=2811234 RepID=A0ABS3CMW1_9BACT|nr:hypothetical protein [Algoriphagus pacificus]MBN7817585.1 hypothetical protein [Algoriphagus pacificus]
MKLYSLFVKAATAALEFQAENGSLPAGNNGPYLDSETPVRNTSHWLITFLKAYQISEEDKFLNAAKNCIAYLHSQTSRPMNATFWHRKNPKKDFSNGLMGQAWTMEALLYAHEVLKDEKSLNLAIEVFKLHPYDKKLSAWKTVNVDGSIRGFDTTFNHQLWFAAIGAKLSKYGDKSIQESTSHFINHIENNMDIYPDGVIKHSPIFYQKAGTKSRLRAKIKELRTPKAQKEKLYSKSVGYHGFNLYALGLIKDTYPELGFFNSQKFLAMMKVVNTEDFHKKLEDSIYGFPYNPPGIELAFAQQQFGEKSKIPGLLSKQFEKSFDTAKSTLNKANPYDLNTAAARFYELYSLDDIDFEFNG